MHPFHAGRQTGRLKIFYWAPHLMILSGLCQQTDIAVEILLLRYTLCISYLQSSVFLSGRGSSVVETDAQFCIGDTTLALACLASKSWTQDEGLNNG